MKPNPNHKRPVRVAPVPESATDPLAEWWKADAEAYNERAKMAVENGATLGKAADTEPGVEDALAHLKQLPPEAAIEKAREWTGRTDISTLEDAVAAVREAAGGN